jgi:hypothetical protein
MVRSILLVLAFDWLLPTSGIVPTDDLPATRPVYSERTFHSKAIDSLLVELQPLFANANIGTLFSNTLPNTLGVFINSCFLFLYTISPHFIFPAFTFIKISPDAAQQHCTQYFAKFSSPVIKLLRFSSPLFYFLAFSFFLISFIFDIQSLILPTHHNHLLCLHDLALALNLTSILTSYPYPDTTVFYHNSTDSDLDTFIVTGDITAMWLRDSANQVVPYLPYITEDRALRELVEGLIFRQAGSILIDPYANAFNFDESTSSGQVKMTITY